ncbi:MAG: hypothetical protein R3B47_00395 [Bacteroidia bacterium]
MNWVWKKIELDGLDHWLIIIWQSWTERPWELRWRLGPRLQVLGLERLAVLPAFREGIETAAPSCSKEHAEASAGSENNERGAALF